MRKHRKVVPDIPTVPPMPSKQWTHKQLVRRMAQWLKVTKRMTVVCSELSTRNSETPDVIGWIGNAASVLIECKTNRADFMADRKKHFRRDAERGMGEKRYMAAPKDLLRVDEIPEGWGLLEVGEVVRMKKEAERMSTSKRNECVMLMSALRRLEISTAVYVVHETPNDPIRRGDPTERALERAHLCRPT